METNTDRLIRIECEIQSLRDTVDSQVISYLHNFDQNLILLRRLKAEQPLSDEESDQQVKKIVQEIWEKIPAHLKSRFLEAHDQMSASEDFRSILAELSEEP